MVEPRCVVVWLLVLVVWIQGTNKKTGSHLGRWVPHKDTQRLCLDIW